VEKGYKVKPFSLNFSGEMRYFLLLVLTFWLPLSGQAQQSTISGYVRDAATGEELIGATVQVLELPGTGATTNIYGYYALPLGQGEYSLKIQYLGYETVEQPINLQADTRLNFELQETDAVLQEVVVTGRREDANVTEVAMSRENLPIETIQKIPALLGEVDVIKTLQLLPGVQSAGEGTTGLFVRGGAADQNLVLLDEATVYNASHLFGFFSVFNPDAIKNLEIYKGGIPARFGGRISSILEIQMKEGNNRNYAVSGGVGLIASRLTVEGPLQKNKSSFIVSGRRTYADMFLRLSNNENLNSNTLYFYDLNAKANLILDENNRVYISGYFGRDVLGLDDLFGLDWGNSTFTARWNHLFNQRLFLNTTLVASSFDYGFEGDAGSSEFTWTSRLAERALKADFTYYPSSDHTLSFGWHSTRRTFGKPDVEFEQFDEPYQQDKYGWENALYVGDQWKVNNKLTAEFGLRYSMHHTLGNGWVYEYEEGQERTLETLSDSTFYATGETIQFYHGLEPRLGLRYILNSESSVKASYMRTRQYLQVASNATAGLPIERWIPVDPYVRPLIGDQVAAGYFRNFGNNRYEFSLEGFYKNMGRLIDFKLGDQGEILFNNYLETELLEGRGWAYGAEFLLKRNTGKTTGWLAYTLSRSFRQVPGISGGNPYPARYDRIHDIALVVSRELSPRWEVSANFVYSTGQAVSLPNGRTTLNGFIVPVYDDTKRNNYRMPDYHRLDLAATLKGKDVPGRNWSGDWVFSVYNAYARKNPFTITFEQVYNGQPGVDPQEEPVTSVEAGAVKTYLFSLIPSVTYNFRWQPNK
jgi:hypothetical protein